MSEIATEKLEPTDDQLRAKLLADREYHAGQVVSTTSSLTRPDDQLRAKLLADREYHAGQVVSTTSSLTRLDFQPRGKTGSCLKCEAPAPDRWLCERCDRAAVSVFAADAAIRRERRLRAIGISSDYAAGRKSFESYTPANDSQAIARSAAIAWAEGRALPLLFLCGPVGTGKTHLASCALIRAIEGVDARSGGYATASFIVFDDFVRRLQGTFKSEDRSEERELYKITSADFVVVDDIGVKTPTSYATSILYALVNARWEDRRPTVFTTNKTVSQLGDAIATRDESIVAERILSRLVDHERASGVVVDGPDHRRARN